MSISREDYFDFWDTNYSHALYLANKHTNKRVKYFTFSSFEWFVFRMPLFRAMHDGSLMPLNKDLELEWLTYRGLKPVHNCSSFAFDIGDSPNTCQVCDTCALVVPIVSFAVKNPYINW